jgi:O-antigen/teichoic acid export membrane protein
MNTTELAQRSRSGAVWAVLNSGAKHGMDLLVFLLLARWLTPQAFGLMALVSTVLVVVVMLAELGLAEALVQRKRLAGVAVDTAFWLLMGVGGVLALGLAALALPLAQVYAQPDLAPLVWALCPLVMVVSLNAVPQALMQRAMHFRPLALRGMVGTLAGGAAGLAAAWAGAGVWSLAAQQLVAAGVGLALLWTQTDWRPRWRFSPAAARQLLGFSRHVMLTRGLNVVASKVDDAVIGFALGPVALGAYAVASRLRLALEQLFCQGIDAVALSAFSRLAAQREALAQAYLGATRAAISLALPVFLSAAWLAPEWLPLLIGSQWNGAMAPLQALLLAGLLQAFLHFNHAVFRAVGRPQRSWQLGLASLALNGLLVTVAVRWGVQAVAWAYLLRVALIGPWGAVLACRELGIGARTFWWTSGAPVLVGAAAVVLTLGLGWSLKPVALMSGTGADALKALLAWLPAIALYGFWLLRHSPAPADLRRRPAADGSRSRKWAPGASRVSRPA